MKKIKTYGKYKTTTNLKSDDWDEIKEAQADPRYNLIYYVCCIWKINALTTYRIKLN